MLLRFVIIPRIVLVFVVVFCFNVNSPQLKANVIGTDMQSFNPTADGIDFITVHSSETLAPQYVNFGIFFNYAVNTLPFFDEISRSRTGEVRDSLTIADLNIAYGIVEDLEVAINLPYIINQEINIPDEASRGEFEEVGSSEIRLSVKYRFFGDQTGGVAAILSTNINRIKNNPYIGNNGGNIYNFEVAADTSISKLALGLNLGYRVRSPGDKHDAFPIHPLDDQFIYSGAASYHFPSLDTKVIFEIFGSTPVKEVENTLTREISTLETLLGLKHDITTNLSVHLGTGTEIIHGTASADWRAYAGVNWAIGPEPEKITKAISRDQSQKQVVKELPVLPGSIPEESKYPEYAGEGDEVFVLRNVHFAFDSDFRVLKGAKQQMQDLAKRVTSIGYEKIILEGHTDSIGTEEYNMDLGSRRAKSIYTFLVEHGKLDPKRLEQVSYGETRPVADNGNYQGRQINRRVVFRVVYKK